MREVHNVEVIALILASCSLLILICIIVFLWWQFNFTDSRLCKLIDNRSKPVEDIEEEES